jgi:hypothetical protein
LFTYSPTFLYQRRFDDLTVSTRTRRGYVNLLDVDLTDIPVSTCSLSSDDIKTPKQATTCIYLKFNSHGYPTSPLMANDGYKDSLDELKELYSQLKKLNRWSMEFPEDDSHYIAEFIQSSFPRRITLEEASNVVANILSKRQSATEFIQTQKDQNLRALKAKEARELKAKKAEEERNLELIKAKKDAEKRIYERNKKERELFKIKKERLAIINVASEIVWKFREHKDYKVGDSVCDQDNRKGNIEIIAEDRFKIFWSMKVVGRKGMAFGKLPLSAINDELDFTYKYLNLNEYQWVLKERVGSCNLFEKI